MNDLLKNEIDLLWKFINYTPNDLLKIYRSGDLDDERIIELSNKFLGNMTPNNIKDVLIALKSIADGQQPTNLNYPNYAPVIKTSNTNNTTSND